MDHAAAAAFAGLEYRERASAFEGDPGRSADQADLQHGSHQLPAAEHHIVQIGRQLRPVAVRHEAHELRIAEATPGITAQSEPDGGAMTGVEQNAKHALLSRNLDPFFQAQSHRAGTLTRFYLSTVRSAERVRRRGGFPGFPRRSFLVLSRA